MDLKLKNAISAFNSQDYYEAHDLLEEFWSDIEPPEKQWIQGLIQLTVVLHLIQEGRLVGAKKVFVRAQNNLMDYQDIVLGIDLKRLELEVESKLVKCINDNTCDFEPPILEIS